MDQFCEYGKRLTTAREKMGVTLEEVSYELKINLNTLKNLEASDSKSLPKPGFTRGFIKAYCGFLSISPTLVLSEYNQTVGQIDSQVSSGVLLETSEPKRFFILDFLKDQFFPLVLFSSVIGAAFILYTFLGDYEDSHSSVTQKANQYDQVAEPVVESGEIRVANEQNEQTELQIETSETLEAIGVEDRKDSEVLNEPPMEKEVAKNVKPLEQVVAVVEEKTEVLPELKKPKYVPPSGKHRLTVEPLAATYLYIKTSTDTRAVRARLVPDKLRSFRFDQAEIRFLDAGAVNLTLDGEELGALGVFGEEKKIDFPSMKEI